MKGTGSPKPEEPARQPRSPTPEPAMPGRIAVVGLGLIGFSLVLSLATSGVPLIGVEPDSQARNAVSGRLETPLSDAELDPLPGTKLAAADLVVLAVPMETLDGVARSVVPFMAKGATLTDTSSLKRVALHCLEQAAPPGIGVVGGHPMAGRERGGAQNATVGLFEGHPWAITAGPRTRPIDVARVTWMARQVDARPVYLDAETHDRAIAVTSHLPYLAASALARATEQLAQADPAVRDLIGTGWRDATRLADQPIWMDRACADNTEPVAEALRRFQQEIASTLSVLSGPRKKVAPALNRVGSHGRRARRALLEEPEPPGPPRHGV